MKTPKLFFLLLLVIGHLSSSAQVQWYQNQDGNNTYPYGTYASSVQPFNSNSFVAFYLWRINLDEYIWKISRTRTNGTELSSLLVGGTAAFVDVRVRENNSVYVLKKSYPSGQNPEFTVYRLNPALAVQAQYTVSFPGNFIISNINAFEIDDDGNVYLAGDGQYPAGGSTGYGSFVLKTNKNFVAKWNRMDSVQTSYVRLHVDEHQRVTVVEDYYDFYPAVKIIRINAAGTSAVRTSVVPDEARYSLSSMQDKSGNLFLYGGKMASDTTQAAYFCKVSRTTGNAVYAKTHFTAPSSQLMDLKKDNDGRLFALASLYYPDGVVNRIARLNPTTGQLVWSRSVNFSDDSVQLVRLAVNNNDKFYAMGDKRSNTYFAKGYALRLKKNGQQDGFVSGPDSVSMQLYHTLVDGIIDNRQKLIAIGNTNDFDTVTYSSTYYRAFAAQLDEQESGCGDITATGSVTEEAVPLIEKIQLYPNPVQNQLQISRLNPAEFDRVAIYDMQGAMVLQQKITTTAAQMDVSNFADGVYLLVLRSSNTLKEKSIKFVVRK